MSQMTDTSSSTTLSDDATVRRKSVGMIGMKLMRYYALVDPVDSMPYHAIAYVLGDEEGNEHTYLDDLTNRERMLADSLEALHSPKSGVVVSALDAIKVIKLAIENATDAYDKARVISAHAIDSYEAGHIST